MHLKKLEIQGFKSFAEKVKLDFDLGVTGIVGPNGSGKSNISDAVRWVLGEQSAKTLRGGKMEDVIFAGTEYRKPLGFAEVTLTFDNTDGLLPVEFSEVTLTRRVYRSGESEYMINKTKCRLKDINEIFLDTGIGKDGYSIIGQGRVDEILSSKSEDRRHIFEEASGIMKYKVRKQEAEKKLEMTKQNLIRINDIIGELENQLEPLRKQSESAKRFLNLRDELKELEISLYIENIKTFKARLEELEKDYNIVIQNIKSEDSALKEIMGLNQKNMDFLKRADSKLERSKQEFYAIEANLERCGSEIKLNEEKKNNLDSNIMRLEEEILETKSRISALAKEKEQKTSKIDYLKGRHSDYLANLKERETEFESLLATLNENERYTENLKSEIMDKLDIQSDKRTQINNIKNHIDVVQKRRTGIKEELGILTLEKDKENIKSKELSEGIAEIERIIKNTNEQLGNLNHKRAEIGTELERERRKQSNIQSEIQVKTSRLRMLKEMERNLEGYNKSVRTILRECQAQERFGEGIHGALAQLIRVDERYETAIEMVLGGVLQNIVTTSEEDAKRAIEFLKKNRLGRATFLPVSSIKARYLNNNIANRLKTQKGFVGIASELISYDPQYSNVILNFLGKVVVVEDLDTAIDVARTYSYGFRIVTLEGDILNTIGSITGGSKIKKESGILGRNRELSELGGIVERLEADKKATEKNCKELNLTLTEVIDKITNGEKSLRNNEMMKIRGESQLTQNNENIKRILARIDMLKQEGEQLIRQEHEIGRELKKYQEELLLIESNIKETRNMVIQNQEKNKEQQCHRDKLQEGITNYRISVNSIKESMEGTKESLIRIKSEMDSLGKMLEKKNLEKKHNQKEIGLLEDKNQGLDYLIKRYEEEKLGKTFEIDRIQGEKKECEEETADVTKRTAQINENILLLKEDSSRIEVKRARVESDIESIQNRMWDEYELTYTNALEIKKDISNIHLARKRINEIKSSIKDLGHVNVAAIEDYTKTKKRFEFMTVQRDDMESAGEKLQVVINEIVKRMRSQFAEQFKLINRSFNKVFRELFEGGRAELILLDSENILESGIDIEVQPPGKKLQNLMLLSGGERAFTAIALLFAILRLNPTPFCVLDEIEAALDDANVYKFARYLKRYSGTTQFILITHRKGSMEVADSLYGVTMQEHGVSKVVSLRMGEKVS
ncbi:MAG: chromosome segregation protein SMC [Clostridium sp.]|nr:chromosome segregation protein SMC [Clostridium sp.]